jgi:sirohydrochlorin cobaltochelatase
LSVNEALLLIGHGSARYPDATDAIRTHADLLRKTGQFAQVEVAALNGAPSVAETLASIRTPVIRVVPFFMEDGYFSRVAVPLAVGPGSRVVMCPPVGVHDGMAGIIERQALAGCAELGVRSHEAAIVVVGHGSASAPGRTLALHRHAARVASTTLFGRVEAACLEETPLVADVLAALRHHPVLVIGFFANAGLHVRDDIPALIAAEAGARGLPVRFQGCVVDDPAVTAIVLDQAFGAGAPSAGASGRGGSGRGGSGAGA